MHQVAEHGRPCAAESERDMPGRVAGRWQDAHVIADLIVTTSSAARLRPRQRTASTRQHRPSRALGQ
jgi:hypothetical protein